MKEIFSKDRPFSFAHFPFKCQLFSDAAPTFQYAFIDQTVQPGEFLNNFQTEKQKDRKTERQKYRKTERQKDRKTERQKDRKTERQKDRKTERQKDRKTEQFCLIFFPNVFI